MTLKIFKFNNKISKEQKIYYEHNGFVVFRDLFKKKEVQLLDKSIEYFADEGWHNIMNPDRISFLLAQSFFKFNKLKSQNEKIKSDNKHNSEVASIRKSIFQSNLKIIALENKVKDLQDSIKECLEWENLDITDSKSDFLNDYFFYQHKIENSTFNLELQKVICHEYTKESQEDDYYESDGYCNGWDY